MISVKAISVIYPFLDQFTTREDQEAMDTTTEINDLPVEMILEIFENLSLHELVVNSSKTCLQWRYIIGQFILAPKILRLANVNGTFKKEIKEVGWTEESNDTELIFSLYQKYEYYSSKYFA